MRTALIRDAVEAWRQGRIKAESAMLIVDMATRRKPTQNEVSIMRDMGRKLKQKGRAG